MLFSRKKTFFLDLDTVADPRIAQFLELGLVAGTFVLPKPPAPASTQEADHRTNRAWETIDRLRHIRGITVQLNPNINEREKLIAALRRSKATLITMNSDLKAACDGLPAISTVEIHNLFKPLFLPGTEVRVRITKRGKEQNEGIGYLEGGVKVVVENGAGSVGTDLDVVVQGALDTGVGRVVFAKPRFTEVR